MPDREPAPRSPLLLPGWQALHRRLYGLEPAPLVLTAPDAPLPRLEAGLYRNDRGRYQFPRLDAYLPVVFTPTPTKDRAKVAAQWLELAGRLAAELRACGVHGPLLLDPAVTDVRPLEWAGFRVTVRYTYQMDFPYDTGAARHAVRKQIGKAERAGMRVEQVTDPADLYTCLAETQERQGFDLGLRLPDVQAAARLLGPEHFRMYVCYTAAGEPASAHAILHAPGTRAVAWLAGTRRAHLTTGANQFLIARALGGLEAAGATGCDFAGADLPSVAAAKNDWGARLLPVYEVEALSVRYLVKGARDLARRRWHARRGRAA